MAAKTGTFSAHFGKVWIGAFLALAAKASANRYPKQEEEDNVSRPENLGTVSAPVSSSTGRKWEGR